MAVDMTVYLNTARATLGNELGMQRSYPTYYQIQATTIVEYYQPDGGILEGHTFMITKTIGSYPFNNVPDSVAASIKAVLDRKLWEYNLNRGLVTSKP